MQDQLNLSMFRAYDIRTPLIQSRVVDRQIRLFFEFPAVRQALSRFQLGEPFGESVATEVVYGFRTV